MSKAQLKKYLKSLSFDQLLQVILDTYDARKEAREYLEYFMNPDEKSAHEKARSELFPVYFNKKGKTLSKVVLKDANKIINDFMRLETAPEMVADLLLYNIELMISRLALRYIMSNTAWNSLIANFRKALDYIHSYDLDTQFSKRILNLVNYAEGNAPTYLNIPERMRQEMEESDLSTHNNESPK